MVDQEKFRIILERYKRDFRKKVWPKEKFKWEDVKHFRDHRNIHAEDFAEMLERATEEICNLLASFHLYSRANILRFT